MQRNVRGILSRLPKTLDETYERVLRDIHEDNKEHARRLLHCLAVAVRPLHVEELAEILTFDFDAGEGGIPEYHADWRWKDQAEAVLSTCSSLITIAEFYGKDDDGRYSRMRVVQFSHFSVKEFLMSNRLATPTRDVSRYHILPEPAHTILAQACLGFLLHLDGHSETERVKDFPLAKYAAKHWVAHAQFQDVASHVKCGMRDLFDPDKPHFSSWIGTYNIDIEEFNKRTRCTPLYYSALCGFHDLAEHLAIKYPQHVNAIGGRYDSSLAAALSGGHVRTAELLLNHGGNVDVNGRKGRTPLHNLLLSSFYLNRKDSPVACVRLLLEHGADVNARDEDYQTPLSILLRLHSWARVHDYHRNDQILVVLRFLLDRGADVNAQDRDHGTALFQAIRLRTSSNTVRTVLEHGADPNLKNKDGKTPLHVLLGPIDYRDADHILIVAQILLEHRADVNSRDKGHETPLHLAVRSVRHETSSLVRLLLRHGADPNSKKEDGKTPLHVLLGPTDYHKANHILTVAQILLERGADVNSRDKGHETPLHLALRHKTPGLVRLLLRHGADPNSKKDGKPLLHVLLRPQSEHPLPTDYYDANWILTVAQILLECGADVNSRDKGHETPLHMAMRHKTSYLVRFLLGHGADPNSENEDGKTPFHLLLGPQTEYSFGIYYHQADYILVVAQLLLERGADVNARDNHLESPLVLALQRQESCQAFNIARFLLEKGANPNIENSDGNTPLHTLLLERNNENDNDVPLFDLLLEHGADMGARNKNQANPLDLAPYYGKGLIAQVLLDHAGRLEGENYSRQRS